MKINLSTIKLSITDCYLPSNFAEQIRQGNELVLTDNNYCILSGDSITTNDGSVWHLENDSDEYSFDEISEEYINEKYSVCAIGRRGRDICTHRENCTLISRQWFVTEYLGENDMVYCEDSEQYCHIDDAYFWDSTEEYNSVPENDTDDNLLWDYGNGPGENDYTKTDSEGGKIFGFGIEIEKSELPKFTFDKQDVYNETGAILEKDGSVSSGFELKTPIYNLFSSNTEKRLEPLRKFADIKGVENAGGHIGFSLQGKTDSELLDLCRGYLPLIYAMYKKRVDNHYCQAKKVKKLKSDNEKFQAIRLRGNYIEFRIFSSVRNFNTVLFRLNFFRNIATNLGASFFQVLTNLLDENSELTKLLRGDIYSDNEKFVRLVRDSVYFDKLLGTNKITPSTIKKMEEKLTNLLNIKK